MKDRVFQLVMAVVAVTCMAVAIWSVLQEEIRSDTRCGPVVTQQNRGVAACDDFYQARYLRVGALFGAAIVAWSASAVVERSIERQGRRVDDL